MAAEIKNALVQSNCFNIKREPMAQLKEFKAPAFEMRGSLHTVVRMPHHSSLCVRVMKEPSRASGRALMEQKRAACP